MRVASSVVYQCRRGGLARTCTCRVTAQSVDKSSGGAGRHRNIHGGRESDYMNVSKQWSVPRTSLAHYPEETRQVIQQKQQQQQQQGWSGTETDMSRDMDQMIAAVEYEKNRKYVDFVGRSGERFSGWLSGRLRRIGALLYGTNEDIARVCEVLEREYARGTIEQKQKVVEACHEVIDKMRGDVVAYQQREDGSVSKRRVLVEDGVVTSAAEEEGAPVKQSGKRQAKQSTIDFRNDFMQTALASDRVHGVNDLDGDQRTALWKSLRETRLTASAFSKALGFFNGDRVSLWEEKIGVREPFKGNDATRWGTVNEARALRTYERLTGEKVESCMFKVKKDDVVHDWLGASPDGLVAGLGVEGGGDGQQYGPGILEIKCPYNKGHPELAKPPTKAIWYYMPQIQGLMDVFDREWCSLYVWTPNHGSSSFVIARDRKYWSACFDILAEFWWAHTVPARQARTLGANEENSEKWMQFRPSEIHPQSDMLKDWSKQLAWSAPGKTFPHMDDI